MFGQLERARRGDLVAHLLSGRDDHFGIAVAVTDHVRVATVEVRHVVDLAVTIEVEPRMALVLLRRRRLARLLDGSRRLQVGDVDGAREALSEPFECTVFLAAEDLTADPDAMLEALREDADVTRHVDDATLARLCDPVNYLGSAGAMVDRALQRCRHLA